MHALSSASSTRSCSRSVYLWCTVVKCHVPRHIQDRNVPNDMGRLLFFRQPITFFILFKSLHLYIPSLHHSKPSPSTMPRSVSPRTGPAASSPPCTLCAGMLTCFTASPDPPPDLRRRPRLTRNPEAPTLPPTPNSTLPPLLPTPPRLSMASPQVCSLRPHRPWVAPWPVVLSDTESATCSLAEGAPTRPRPRRRLLPSTPTKLGRSLVTAISPPRVSYNPPFN